MPGGYRARKTDYIRNRLGVWRGIACNRAIYDLRVGYARKNADQGRVENNSVVIDEGRAFVTRVIFMFENIDYRVKNAFKLLLMVAVAWWGMGHTVPSNITEGIEILFGVAATVYGCWKNFDFTDIAHSYTTLMRAAKKHAAEDGGADYTNIEEDEEVEDNELVIDN